MRDFHAPGRSQVIATGAMAATSMPAATMTALDVLRRGGNALDAAIAAAATLAVIEPQSTGLGGDCFCLYAPAGTGQVVALNGSGRAPAAATAEALLSRGVVRIEVQSPHAVTIPGAVAAWEALWRAHGKAPWDSLFQDAIRFAEHGHPVHARVAWDWAAGAAKLAADPAAARLFLKDGAPYAEGDILVQPALARTLRAIAARGARAFYEGGIAAGIVATLRAKGGLHTEEDFAAGATAAEFVAPIRRGYRGHEVVECPPNGSGVIALMLLGMLEGFSPPPGGPLSVTRLHRHIEAARLAYRDRDAFLADPAEAEVPLARLLSDAYLGALRALIRDDSAMPELPPAGAAEWLPRHEDTVYLCVVDRDGNACSFINSLFEAFGSGIADEASGVLLHNRGTGFRIEPGHPNCIAPMKRPLHTIIPALLMKDGETVMPFGVMGGHYQPMGQSWFLANHLDHGLDLQESLDLPRIFPRDGEIQCEHGVPEEALAGLAALGHRPVRWAKPHGGGQAILIDRARGVLVGASDARKDGCAMGLP
ncbi:MAG: gamma-glutamyltransferase family protein [Acetobacteraceae bacterium]|nr:gamma-glutamyltransferase family protein [Acetobacteraceae bacterium]